MSSPQPGQPDVKPGDITKELRSQLKVLVAAQRYSRPSSLRVQRLMKTCKLVAKRIQAD